MTTTFRDLPWLQYLYGLLFYVIVVLVFALVKMIFHLDVISWIWVAAPLWIPLGLSVIILFFYGIYELGRWIFRPGVKNDTSKEVVVGQKNNR